MSGEMLKFVDQAKAMPQKREAQDRVGDFDEIYGDFDISSAQQSSRCSQCGVPFVRSIAHCIITFLTG